MWKQLPLQFVLKQLLFQLLLNRTFSINKDCADFQIVGCPADRDLQRRTYRIFRAVKGNCSISAHFIKRIATSRMRSTMIAAKVWTDGNP